jgi:ABC-type Fe3+-hydroxamate transport system substrate-binding protein
MNYPKTITDQLGATFMLTRKPERIISLVPSQTELLADLGLNEGVIGITKFCIHPDAWFRTKTRVGGTKQLNLDTIRLLNPDLIIGNKEENLQEQILELQKEFPVWMSDITNLEQSLEMIRAIGNITDSENRAEGICNEVLRKFSLLQPSRIPLRTLYFIWKEPYMCAGSGTFISDMLNRCGLINVATGERYPELSADEIVAIKPELILLSSEPYPFQEKHIELFRRIVPTAQIHCVDGEMFSWYGSRLTQAPLYFNTLLSTF